MSIRVYNGAEVKADLYNRITSDGELELLLGDTAIGDIPRSGWRYDINSSATDNFSGGVIQPTLQTGNGRWIRIWVDPGVPSPSMQTRSFNSSFQPSTAQVSNVSYSVSISVQSIVLGTNSGNVFLEISSNDSDWTTIAQVGLSIAGVAATTINSYHLSGYIPAGYFVRLRTTESGTNGADFTYLFGQETLL